VWNATTTRDAKAKSSAGLTAKAIEGNGAPVLFPSAAATTQPYYDGGAIGHTTHPATMPSSTKLDQQHCASWKGADEGRCR
jgi:hypothetical protein